MPGGEGDDLGQLLRGHHLGRPDFGVGGKDAVPACRAPKRRSSGPAARDPDRDPRPLHRDRPEGRPGDLVVLAVVFEPLAAPEPGEDRQPLVEAPRPHPGVGGLAEGGELGLGAEPRPAPKTRRPLAEPVERGGLAGDLPRAPAGERADEHPEPDPLGGRGGGGDRNPRVGDRGLGLVVGEVVPDEAAVPARGLGVAGRARPAAGSPYSRTFGIADREPQPGPGRRSARLRGCAARARRSSPPRAGPRR